MTLGNNITADYDGKAPAGLTVTLSYSGEVPAGYEATYSVNDSEIEGNTFTMPNGNVKVTAIVTPIEYTIMYVLDDRQIPDDRNDPETYTIESDTFTLPIPTRKYYKFAGWIGEGLTEATQTVTIEKGSTGNRTYSATWTQHGFMPKSEDTPEFVAYSMVLGGTLSVRFYVYHPGTNSDDYVMQFTVSGDYSPNPDDYAPTVSVQSGDATLYGYDCYINSAQMADTINAALFKGDVTESVIDTTYSAKQYLDAVAGNSDSYKEYEVALIEAIRDYGHFVQPMLSKVNGWTIGEKYALMPSTTTYETTDIDAVKEAVKSYTITRAPNTDIKQVLYSLTLGANTTINFYIYHADEYKSSVTVDDGLTLEKLSESQYRE